MEAGNQHVTVVPANDKDVPLVLHFIRTLAEYEDLGGEVVATEASLREALFGPRPVAECVIARVDGKPVGFALFYPTFSTFLGRAGMHLEDLFVIEEYRGNGVGKALLAYLTAVARERGYARVDWHVLDWNRSAQEFYKTIGARPLPEWVLHRLKVQSLERVDET